MTNSFTRHLIQLLFLISFIFGIYTSLSWLPIAIIIITLTLGPLFCSYICPMGFVQDIMHKLAVKLKIKQRTMPQSLHSKLIYIRYFVFIAVTFLGFQWLLTLLSYDPRVSLISIFTGREVTIIAYCIILFFLLVSLFYQRPFCSYLCYEGAKYSLMSPLRLFRVHRHKNTCVKCNKCNNTCPMHVDIMNNESVNSLQCIQCQECIIACPKKGALTLERSDRILKGKLTKDQIKNKLLKKQNLVLFPLIFAVLIMFDHLNMESFPEYKNTKAVIVDQSIVPQQDAKGIKDGVYKGSSQGFNGSIQVAVTIKSEKITEISITNHQDDARWFNQANKYIPSAIIANQTTNVDSVSMATYSSTGIINAVKNALGQKDFLEMPEGHGHGHEKGHRH